MERGLYPLAEIFTDVATNTVSVSCWYKKVMYRIDLFHISALLAAKWAL